MPEVSVIIPLYNKGPHIARALKSVLNQTFQSFEIIVIDDGSTDDGADVVRSFNNDRIWLIQQEKLGVASARNVGIEKAHAELIALLDADDEWMPEHLAVLLKLREKYPEAGAYTTAYLKIYSNSKIKKPNFYDIPEKPCDGLLLNYFKSAALGESPISASSVGLSKDVLIKIGAFNTTAFVHEDADLWARIALKYPIAFSWAGESLYHTEASNRTCDMWIPLNDSIAVKSARAAIESGEVLPELYEDLVEYVAKKEIEIAYRNLKAGRPDFARKNLKHCRTKHLNSLKYTLLFCTYLPVNIFKRLLIFEDYVKEVLLKP